MEKVKQTVVVLGASPDSERYSNQAVRILGEHGHRVIPVHPTVESIEDLPVKHRLDDINEKVDTLSVYVSAKISSSLCDAIIRLNPIRVIFNPGAENSALGMKLEDKGIAVEEACTLVLLRTGQF